MTNRRYFVVAPSYQWFKFWCHDNGIDPHDREAAIYIREMRDVQGLIVIDKEQIIDLGPFDPKRYELVLALTGRIRNRE